jgi:hypothetical protein
MRRTSLSTAIAAALIVSLEPAVFSADTLSVPPSAAESATAAAPVDTARVSGVRPVPTVVGWGTEPRNVPSILDRFVVVEVAAGDEHNLALTRGGRVVAWGSNLFHRAEVPSALDEVTVSQVAVGKAHNLALTSTGDVIAWGSNRHDQTEVPPALEETVVAQIAAGLSRLRRQQRSTAGAHNLALTTDGNVVAWGANDRGQTTVPPALAGVMVTEVAAGGRHSLALTEDGIVVAWGANGQGQTDVPAALDDATVTQVAAGGVHSLALTAEGRVVAWGKNGGRTHPAQAPAMLDQVSATKIDAGGRGNLAIARYQGPDLTIGGRKDRSFGLKNAFDVNGLHLGGDAAWSDVVSESFCLREPRRFFVRVFNDAGTTRRVRLMALSGTPSRVRYHYRGTEVTSRITAAGLVLEIPSGRYRVVKMDLTLGPCPYARPPGTRAFLTAHAIRQPGRFDRVRARVRIFW